MTVVHRVIEYLIAFWHEFARTVHLETKQGKQGFWHSLNTWLVAVPVGGFLIFMGLLALLTALMLTVPIAKLVGYDLGDKFAKMQAKLLEKLRPAMWLPFVAGMHSDKQRWVSVSPAEAVFGDIVKAVKRMGDGSKGSVDVVEVNKKEMTIKVHVFSPQMKCLDVMELKCGMDANEMGGTAVEACSFTPGAAPLALPPYVGLVSSLFMFWLPFSDGGSNKKRLDDLRQSLQTEVRLAPGSTKGKSE